MVDQFLTDNQKQMIKEWKDQVYIKAIEKQKEKIDKNVDVYSIYEQCWEEGFPYCGAIGGQFSYIITPTSIGTIIKIKCSITDLELDITDYSWW